MLPLFSEHSKVSYFKAYEWQIQTEFGEEESKGQKPKNIAYSIEWNFYQSALDLLVSSEGESLNNTKMIIKELFLHKIFDSYYDNDSTIILNSGMKIAYSRKSVKEDLEKLLHRWKESDQTVYQTDQLVTVCQNFLAILDSTREAMKEESIDLSSSQKQLSSAPNDENSLCLLIKVVLHDPKNRNKTYKYKIIKSIDQVQLGDQCIVSFDQMREIPLPKDISIETDIFKAIYQEDVIQWVVDFYKQTDSLKYASL